MTSLYRGRLAPSPTGFLHVGHAFTFLTAYERAKANGGTLVFRNEDLDFARCKPGFVDAIVQDLEWLGIDWQEGVGRGGDRGPYSQSDRAEHYRRAFDALIEKNLLYPCTCSRQDVLKALSAPHEANDEPLYPGTCREKRRDGILPANLTQPGVASKVSWRFRVPEDCKVTFTDSNYGEQTFVAGKDFGDFVVWRHDNVSSYQLAVTVDDAAMGITEVVRGADLLISTARQILLYQALELAMPTFYHCELITDESGVRLAKRNDSLAIRTLRQKDIQPAQLKDRWKQLVAKPMHAVS